MTALPKISAPEDYVRTLNLSLVQVTQVRKVTILHTPVKDILTENNAVRATAILNSVLSSLAAREAIIDKCTSERI